MRQSLSQLATIGQRSSNGRYDVTYPDGGKAIGKAEKIFDAKSPTGTTLSAINRRDGVVLLNGPTAYREPTAADRPLALPALVDRCDGYLRGQIFNCAQGKRKTLAAWAIGYWETAVDRFAYLLDLNTGDNWFLAGCPKFVSPCALPPPNFPPPETPAPPLESDEEWYQHVWISVPSYPPPPLPRCGNVFPPPPSNALFSTGGFRNTLRAPDGTIWDYRNETWQVPNPSTAPGAANEITVGSASLVTYSASKNPPTIPIGPLAVISTGLLNSVFTGIYNDVSGGLGNSGWIYAAAQCAPVGYNSPPVPIDTRDPNGAPVPNTIELTVSIGADGGPIALVRHSPNCHSPGVWNFEKSFRVTAGNLTSRNGRLATDWRHTTPAFPCQSTFKADPFVQISVDRAKLWAIEPDDRPDPIPAQGEAPIKVTEKQINPSDCPNTTTLSTREIPAQNGQFNAMTIASIAVQWSGR